MVLPTGIVSTAWPAVEATCREIGIEFDQWQQDLNRCILSKDRTGDYAADTVLLSIARQVGKTFLVGALVFADSIINPGTTTVWTAHRFKVSRETFNELRALARTAKLLPHIDPDDITSAAGNECIPFRNGSRILFAARERGAVRGFAKVRRLVLDEAQILTESALSDMAPTMNQATNPQVILMGTPPKPNDPGEVFTNLRADALEGRSEGVIYAELSADPDADLDDRAQWSKANLSYPDRTKAKAILRLRKLLGDEDFRREGLGIWDVDNDGQVFPASAWLACLDIGSDIVGPPVFALEVSEDRKWSAFAQAGRSDVSRGDFLTHVAVADYEPGTAWVVRRALQLAKHGQIAVAKGSPAASLLKDLVAAGLRLSSPPEPTDQLMVISTEDQARMCGQMYDAVVNQTLRHRTDPRLDVALQGAVKRQTGDAWVLSRLRSTIDITPLVAVTWAAGLFGAGPPPVDPLSQIQ